MIIERWFVSMLNMINKKITKDSEQEFEVCLGMFKHNIKIESVTNDNVTISCSSYMLQENGYWSEFGSPYYTHYDSMPSPLVTTSKFYDYIVNFDRVINMVHQQLQEYRNQ